MTKTVGILALQGAFAKHIEILETLKEEGFAIRTAEVRDPGDLPDLDALIIPGGESTTISKMLVRWELLEPLAREIRQGLPVYGTCAGLILLADRLVDWDDLPRPGGLNAAVARNAYGRQIDSFEAALDIVASAAPEFDGVPFDGVFIRAPKIVDGSIGSDVEVLAAFEGLPVLVRQGNLLAGTFHPELTGDFRIHRWFLKEIVRAGEVKIKV